MTVIIPLMLLTFLLMIGLPVAFSLLLAGTSGLLLVGGYDLAFGILSSAPTSSLGSYELLTIPMFLLMAEFMVASAVAPQLFNAIAVWTGRLPGGLGVATAVAGAAFGAISGSSTASAATLSSSSVPAMIRHGYNADFAAGIVSISGTLAMIIPPSIALIFYGLLSDTDIGKLLIAGIVPGLLVTLVIAITTVILALRDPTRAPVPQKIGFGEKVRSLRTAGPFLLLFGLVSGLIYSGIATPVEASAMGAVGAMVLAMAYGRLNFIQFRTAVAGACITSSVIGLIVVCAHVFGYFLTLTGVTQHLVEILENLNVSPYFVIAALVVLYLVLGLFMDLLSILILTVPVVMPVVIKFGIDPIWFGIVVIILAEIGMVSPPIGMNVFVVAKASGLPADRVFIGVYPFIIALLGLVSVFILFPDIILWLPNQMK